MDNKTLQRFWSYVDVRGSEECWPWLSWGNNGRGRFTSKGTTVMASRVMWSIHYGEIPDGLFVLHKCDNPTCVNPKHLEIGTKSKNLRDAYRRLGRKPMRGTRSGMSKLIPQEVLEIVKRHRSGSRICDLADEYNVSRPCIASIVHRRNWVWLTGDNNEPV